MNVRITFADPSKIPGQVVHYNPGHKTQTACGLTLRNERSEALVSNDHRPYLVTCSGCFSLIPSEVHAYWDSYLDKAGGSPAPELRSQLDLPLFGWDDLPQALRDLESDGATILKIEVL